MKGVSRIGVSVGCVLACLLSITASAQVDQGRIVGTVRDPSQAVIAGADITVVNERTGEKRKSTTDEQGYYVFLALKPSTYTVQATTTAFGSQEATGLTLQVGQELRHDFTLNIQGSSQVIEVIEASVPLIDTSSARMGVNVGPREVLELPVNGRQLSQLALQAPGSLNSGSGTYNDLRFSGRANQQNALRYDGVEGSAVIDASAGNLNGEIPSPFKLQTSLETVQEFRVDSNSYPAEYGTGTGGQISVITKSGGNSFHGAVFEFLRNEKLDARNFFDTVSKSKLRLNQFGGSLGGPILKDKLFFFGAYEGYRLRSGVNFVEAVPSAAARARAVPAVVPLLDAFKDPNAVILPGKSTNPDFDIAQLQANNNVDENSGSLRLDYRIGANHTIYGRYFRDQGTNDQPEGVTGRHALIRDVPQNAVLSLVSLFGTHLVNDFKFGYNSALSRVNGIAPLVNGIDLSAITINITGSVANSGIAGQGGSSGIAIPGGLLRQNSATNGRGAPYTPYTFSWIDGLSWQHGRHSFKFGAEFRMLRIYTDRLGGTTYTFQNLNGFLANTAQQIQYLADVSAPSPFNGGATGNRFAKQEYYIGYIQDEWRLRHDLTLNYGLRYEYYTPMREDRNLDVLFNLTNGTLNPPGSDFYQASTKGLGPRVGLAWSPGRLKQTVFRSGFGIYYGPGQTEDTIQPIESDRISSTLTGGAFPVDTGVLAANFISNPQNRQYQPRAYAPEYTVPERIYSYTASIERELPGKFAATVAYVGSQGRNLFLRSITNRIVSVRTIPNADPTKNPTAVIVRQFDIDNGGTNVLRPFAEIDYKTSGGTDSYNALQTSLVRRTDHGLTMAAQYTYGKSFGNSSGSNEAQTAGNPFDFNYDRGYNNFDVRHLLNLSLLYEFPFGRGKHWLSSLGGVSQAVLGGWQAGGIFSARSGLPIDVKIVRPDIVWVDPAGAVFTSAAPGRTAVVNTLGGGASRNVRRPNVVSGVDPFLVTGDGVFLNPAAFSTPAPGTFGNLMRGALHGPSFQQVDFTLSKSFRFTESTRLEFRTEMFNVFNKTNFANPPAVLPSALSTTLQPGQPFTAATAGTFGKLNSTVSKTVGLGTDRQIQFGLRLSF